MLDALTVRLEESTAAIKSCSAALQSPAPSSALGSLQAYLLPNVIARNKAWLAANRNSGNDSQEAIDALVDGTAQLEAIMGIPAGTRESMLEAFGRIAHGLGKGLGETLPHFPELPNLNLGLGVLGVFLILMAILVVKR